MKDCLAVVGVEEEAGVKDVLDGSTVKLGHTNGCGGSVKVVDGCDRI